MGIYKTFTRAAQCGTEVCLLSGLRLSSLARSPFTITGDHETEPVLLQTSFRATVSVDSELSEQLCLASNQCETPSSLLWSLVNLLERIAAALCLFALLPVLFLVGTLVAVLSRRSPFVSHRRVGRNGRELWVLKFRTMWGHPSSGNGKRVLVERIASRRELESKRSSDPRVTSRFAAFCRKYSVDELPQLWHVVRGDMALIGPRPLTVEEIVTFYGPDADRLLLARPGLSGLWQVNGRNRLTLEERRRLDLFMLDNWSLKLYLQILQATLPCVLSGRNAW